MDETEIRSHYESGQLQKVRPNILTTFRYGEVLNVYHYCLAINLSANQITVVTASCRSTESKSRIVLFSPLYLRRGACTTCSWLPYVARVAGFRLPLAILETEGSSNSFIMI